MTLSARDLEPGQILTGPSRTITQADLTFACMASGDWSPIHADAEFAAATPLGGPVMPGGYGLMIALGMSAQVLHLAEPVLALLGLDNWRFAAPIQAGTPSGSRSRWSGSAKPATARAASCVRTCA